MLDKKPKPKDIDRIIKYVNQEGEGKNPIDLTDKEMEKWARISFSHDQRKKGYSRKQVVKMLQDDYGPMSLDTAYRIVRETELVMGPIGVSPKDYAKVLAEEWALQGIRMSIASKDLRHLDRFLGKFMELHNVKDGDAETIPASALDGNVVHLTLNPEEAGMKMITQDELQQFIAERLKEPAPKILDVTSLQDDGTEE